MKSLALVASLGVVAIVLEGCGGSGGSSSTSCLNPTLNVVSQSSTGKVTGTVVDYQLGDKPAKVNLPSTEKIDFDKFNIRFDIASGKIDLADGSAANVDVKFIFNAAKKEGVAWYKTEFMGQTNQNCTKMTYDKLPAPEVLSTFFKGLVVPELQKAAICGGNDGTLDTWKLALDSRTVPIPAPLPGNVTMDMKVKMDKNYLVNAVNGNFELDINGTAVHAKLDLEQSPSAGGPQESDLDYSAWGTCHPANPPGKASDVHTLFQPADTSKVALILEKIINEGFFRKMLLATMQAKLASRDEAVVV